MYEQLNYVPTQVADIYAASTQRTRTMLYVVGGILFAVLIYWLVVRYIGKNISSGKAYIDNQTPPQNGSSTSTTGQNNGGNTTSTTPEDPFMYANELNLKLTSTWLGVCAAPDEVCYRLMKLANGDDNFKIAVGRAYQSSQGTKLSEAISKNPCCCTDSLCGYRYTKFVMNKQGLISKLQSMGY
jgi:hypothetical protein